MSRGINRAEYVMLFESAGEDDVTRCFENEKCVFISHKSSDSEAALALANYLKDNDIDVYIDINDEGLQVSAKANDAEGIVSYIQQALEYSTHILVLISDDTRNSWWVPYEIGYAKNGGKDIASLLLKNFDGEFPDYLKIECTISNKHEFEEYVRTIADSNNQYGVFFE